MYIVKYKCSWLKLKTTFNEWQNRKLKTCQNEKKMQNYPHWTYIELILQ